MKVKLGQIYIANSFEAILLITIQSTVDNREDCDVKISRSTFSIPYAQIDLVYVLLYRFITNCLNRFQQLLNSLFHNCFPHCYVNAHLIAWICIEKLFTHVCRCVLDLSKA